MKLHEIAQFIGAQLHGDPDCDITGVASLQDAIPGTISFLSNSKYQHFLADSKASAVILDLSESQNYSGNILRVENVYLAYAKVATVLNTSPDPASEIHKSAQIHQSSQFDNSVSIAANVTISENVTMGKNCYIGPGCVIEKNVSLGDDVRLLANVVLCHDVKLGSRVLLHPGVVVGSDGFGIANDRGVWFKVPQLGSVLIADDVEIGANTTIDRGALENTIIEQGVKLDNQIQIAHNVKIGAHTAIAGCVGIAGSAVIGKHCGIGGGSVILGHLEITDQVEILAMSLVSQSIKNPGQYSSGTPVQDKKTWNKNNARLRKLDELSKRVKQLEKEIKNSQRNSNQDGDK